MRTDPNVHVTYVVDMRKHMVTYWTTALTALHNKTHVVAYTDCLAPLRDVDYVHVFDLWIKALLLPGLDVCPPTLMISSFDQGECNCDLVSGE